MGSTPLMAAVAAGKGPVVTGIVAEFHIAAWEYNISVNTHPLILTMLPLFVVFFSAIL